MNFLLDAAPAHAGTEVLERILATSSGLVVLDGPDSHTLIKPFQVIARHTGQSMYLWQADVGLVSLRDAHVRVPDCERLGNALRYMLQSMHFGIYFMLGLELPLSALDAELLRQLSHAPEHFVRRVVLLDAPVALAGHLGPLAEHVDNGNIQPRRLRLRDGRWLV